MEMMMKQCNKGDAKTWKEKCDKCKHDTQICPRGVIKQKGGKKC